METIIIATDFSHAATNAALYAAELANALQKELLILYIDTLPVTYADVPIPTRLEEMTEMGEMEIKKLQERLILHTTGNISITTEIQMGTFFTTLTSVCERVHPYAVVMGSQGTTASERFFFGGHTVHAMKHLKWPLITVPPQAKFSPVTQIGLACDFENILATTPLSGIRKLVKDFHAKLHVLNSGSGSEYNPDTVFESALLEDLLSGLDPEFHYITDKDHDPDKALVDFVKNNHIQLLLVLPKQHHLLESIFHKSHTKQLVLNSDVPVMALH
ncbi:Nucleotide-binding universal stress protein, UspA family [Filimonas lacunae]|uniref:Nucleotide-binding universal stress protein, UspA family n=1 Tax=Filimonas lacunae TaxID=477680 RepID=A0A173MHB4_9BACT|nr:universal stress protein [Filimonas lacunae]BAV06867.1 universal stress protein UspA [Filimonas lacunae]SIS98636.1 Nucleotide-binding universal stress protein, UspA family [Filimonas lacunae]